MQVILLKTYMILQKQANGSWLIIEEMMQKGYEHCENKLIKIPLSDRGYAHLNCSQLIRLWQWGDMGDLLRREMVMEQDCE